MQKYRLLAEVVDFNDEVIAHDEAEEELDNDAEAVHLSRDLAWDLYEKVADTHEDIPSYATLVERYRSEWFDLSEQEFNRAIDDMYIKTIDMHIDYWIQEVKE